MRQKILFVDVTSPLAYDPASGNKQAVGGTESSVMRTAELLSLEYDVCVAQQARTNHLVLGENLAYRPLAEALSHFEADEIILLRKFSVLKTLRRQFPRAGLCLWLHTYKSSEYVLKKPFLQKLKVTLVGNSRTHQTHLDAILNQTVAARLLGFGREKVPVRYCYNPIPEPAVKQPARRDPHKLIFLSSPNKGLDQVLEAFQRVRQHVPGLRLCVANPGYRPNAQVANQAGVEALGALPHAQVMRQVAESLCVFYPQDTFAETFGLIYAEANALGVPVLGCDVGAAREILHPANPLVKAGDYPSMVDLIRQWQKQPPAVNYRSEFSPENVFRQWQALFQNRQAVAAGG